MVAELEKLDTRGRPLTPEEEDLAELMTLLVRQFEESKYPLGHAEPLEALRALMEDRDLRQRDLIPAFGASSVVSDVLNGKRAISKSACAESSPGTSAFRRACLSDRRQARGSWEQERRCCRAALARSPARGGAAS